MLDRNFVLKPRWIWTTCSFPRIHICLLPYGGFLNWGIPTAWWFIVENLIGTRWFRGTNISGNLHIYVTTSPRTGVCPTNALLKIHNFYMALSCAIKSKCRSRIYPVCKTGNVGICIYELCPAISLEKPGKRIINHIFSVHRKCTIVHPSRDQSSS